MVFGILLKKLFYDKIDNYTKYDFYMSVGTLY